jgi:Mg2+ and Co2+ transporter CorA
MGNNETRKVSEHTIDKSFDILRILKDGTYDRELISLKQMTQDLPRGFRIRDLRGTSTRQISQILVRDGHFWVILENLMAVVTAENLFMFRASSVNVREFAKHLSETIKQIESTNSPYHVNAFELIVLEEMLSSVVNDYAYRINLILPVVKTILNSFGVLTGIDTDNAVVRLIPMTNTLTNFQTSISELRSAVDDVLHNEEDLMKLCLTNQDRRTRLEVEMLLENISKKAEELFNEVKEILSNIRTTRTAMEMIMSNTKSYLMTMNLHISLLSLTLSSAAVIGSIFGMNLWSGYEDSPYMFYVIISLMPIVGLSIYFTFSRLYLGRQQQFADTTRLSLLSSNFFDKLSSPNYIKKLANETTKEEFRRIILEAIGKDIPQEETDKIFDEIQSSKEELDPDYIDTDERE